MRSVSLGKESVSPMSESSSLDNVIDIQAATVLDSNLRRFVSKFSQRANVFQNSPSYLFCKSSLYFKDSFHGGFVISSAQRLAYKPFFFPADALHADQAAIAVEESTSSSIYLLSQQLMDAFKSDDTALIISLTWNMINVTLDDTNAQLLFAGIPGLCRSLVFILSKFDHDLSVIEATLTAISILTRCGESRSLTNMKVLNLFMAAQAPDVVVQILRSHIADSEICERACLCISHLAYDKKQRLQFAAAGTCEYLMNVMKFHSSSLPVIGRALNAIVNLLPEESCHTFFSQFQLLSVVMPYIQFDNESIVVSICSIVAIIYNHHLVLLSDEHENYLTPTATWRELVRVFNNWKESSDVIGHCLSAMSLVQLMSNNIDNEAIRLCPSIVRIIRAYPACHLTRIYGIMNIVLIYRQQSHLSDVFSHMEECAVLVDILRGQSSAIVMELSCLGLTELIRCNNNFQGYLNGNGLCSVLARLVESVVSQDGSPEPPSVLFAVCNLVVAMAQQNAIIQIEFLHTNIVIYIVNALSKYDDVSARCYILRAAAYLCGVYNVDESWSADIALAFFQSGVLNYVMPLLLMSPSDELEESMAQGGYSVQTTHLFQVACHMVCALSLAGHVMDDECKMLVGPLVTLLNSDDMDILTSACAAAACLSASSRNRVIDWADLQMTLVALLHRKSFDEFFFPCCCYTLRNLIYCANTGVSCVGNSARTYIENGVIDVLCPAFVECVDRIYSLRAALCLFASIIEAEMSSSKESKSLAFLRIDDLAKQLFWLLQQRPRDSFVVEIIVRVLFILYDTVCLKSEDFIHRPAYGEAVLAAAEAHLDDDDDEVSALCLDLLNAMTPLLTYLSGRSVTRLIVRAIGRYHLKDEIALCACYLLTIVPVELCRDNSALFFHKDECKSLMAILTGSCIGGDDNMVRCAIKAISRVLCAESSCQEIFGSLGICDQLIGCLSRGDDLNIKLCSLWCIKYLCMRNYHSDANTHNTCKVVDGNIVDSIVSLLKYHHSTNPDVSMTCCSVLRCVSATDVGIQALRTTVVCELMFSVLEERKDVDAIVIQSCDILSSILPFDNMYAVVETKIDFLCDLLQGTPSDLVLFSSIRFIISLLDISENTRLETLQELFYQKDIFKLLTCIAQLNVADTILNCLVLTCLKVVIHKNSCHKLAFLNNTSCVAFVRRCLSHPDCAMVSVTTDLLLDVFDEDCVQHDLVGDLHIVVMEVLQQCIDDARIARNCCLLLQLFCEASQSIVDSLMQKGQLDVVMTAFRLHHNDSKLSTSALDLISVLSNIEGGPGACESAVLSLRGILECGDDAQVATTVSIVQNLLLYSVDDQARLTTAATFSTLILLMSKWRDNHYVESLILKTLWCMCRCLSDSSNYVAIAVDLLVDESGLDGVLSVLSAMWMFPNIAEFGFGILHFVVSHRQEVGNGLDGSGLARLSASALESHLSDCEVVMNISLFIAALVVLPVNAAVYQELNICDLLCSAMDRFCVNERCVLQLTLAISGLVYTQGLELASRLIHHTGNVPVLLNVIGAHASSTSVVSALCILIVNLTILLEDEFTVVLQNCNGVADLLSVIQMCSTPGQRDILGHVLDVVYMLCMNDSEISSQLSTLGGFDILVSEIEGNFRNDPRILKMSCLCIYAMTDGEDNTAQDILKIFLIAVEVLRRQLGEGEAEVALAACMMISNLLGKPETVSTFLSICPMETLASTFVANIEVKDVTDQCCSILLSTIQDEKCCEAFGSEEALLAIVYGMDKHIGDVSTCIKLISLVHQLVTCSEVVAARLIEKGVLDAAHRVVSTYSNNTELLRKLFMSMYDMCTDSTSLNVVRKCGILTAVFEAPNVSDILDLGAATPWVQLLIRLGSLDITILRLYEEWYIPVKLMNMLEKHKDDVEFVCLGAAAVDILCHSSDMCSAFGRAGCCQFISQQLGLHQDFTEANAGYACALLEAVSGLSTDCENQQVLGDITTCAHIVNIIGLHVPDIELAGFKALTALAYQNVLVQNMLFELNVHKVGQNVLNHQDGSFTLAAVVVMCFAAIAEHKSECMQWCIENDTCGIIDRHYTSIVTIDRDALILCSATALFLQKSDEVPTKLSTEKFVFQSMMLWNRALEMIDDATLGRPVVVELLKIVSRLCVVPKIFEMVNPSQFSDVVVRTLLSLDLEISCYALVIDIVNLISRYREDISCELCRTGVLDCFARLLRSSYDYDQLTCALCRCLILFARSMPSLTLMCAATHLIDELKASLQSNSLLPVVVGDLCTVAARLLHHDPYIMDCDVFSYHAVNCLISFTDNAEFMIHICQAISDMSAVSMAISDALGRLCVGDGLIAVIRRHVDNEDVLATAIATIRNLTAESNSNVIEFGDKGVCEILIDCTRKSSLLTTMVDICMAITNLCSDNEKNSCFTTQHNGVEVLVGLLKKNHDNTEAVIAICGVLQILVSYDFSVQTQLADQEVSILFQGMVEQYKSNPEVLSTVLNMISIGGSSGEQKIDSDVCANLVESFKGHLDDTVMVGQVCSSITGMIVISPESATILGNCGLCELALDVAERFIMNAETIEKVFILLGYLAMESERNLDLLAESGVQHILVRCFGVHADVSATICALSFAARYMSYGEKISHTFFEIGIPQILLKSVEKYLEEHAEVAENACRALRKLLMNELGNDVGDTIPEIMATEGVRIAVNVALVHPERDECVEASLALMNCLLSSSDDAKISLFSHDVIDFLYFVEYAKAHTDSIWSNVHAVGIVSKLLRFANNVDVMNSTLLYEFFLDSIASRHTVPEIVEECYAALVVMTKNNPRHVSTFLDRDNVEVMLSCLSTFAQNVDMVRNIFSILEFLGHFSDCVTRMSRANIYALVTSIGFAHIDDCAVSAAIFTIVITFVSTMSSESAKWGEYGMCQLCAELLNKHISDDTLVADGFLALWYLLSGCPGNTKYFCNVESAAAIVATMKKCPQEFETTVLNSLLSAELVMTSDTIGAAATFASSDIIAVVTEILANHHCETDSLFVPAVRVVTLLSTTSENRAKFNECAIQKTLLEIIVDSMTFTSSTLCKIFAAMRCLCNDNETLQLYFLQDEHLRVITCLLEKSRDDLLLWEQICGVLCNLAKCPLAPPLSDALLRHVLTVMRSNISEIAVCRISCEYIFVTGTHTSSVVARMIDPIENAHKIIKYYEDAVYMELVQAIVTICTSHAHCKALKSTDTVSILIRALSTTSPLEELHMWITKAIYCILCDPVTQQVEFSNLDDEIAMISELRRVFNSSGATDASIHSSAVMCNAMVAKRESMISLVSEKGVCEAVVFAIKANLAHWTDMSVCKEVCQIVVSLSSDSKCRIKMVVVGLLEFVIDLMESLYNSQCIAYTFGVVAHSYTTLDEPDNDKFQTAVGLSGVFPSLLKSIECHVANDDISLSLLQALRSLSHKHQSNCESLAKVQVIPLLCVVLSKFCSLNVVIARECSSTIASIAKECSSARKLIAENGLCEWIVKCLQWSLESGDFSSCAVFLETIAVTITEIENRTVFGNMQSMYCSLFEVLSAQCAPSLHTSSIDVLHSLCSSQEGLEASEVVMTWLRRSDVYFHVSRVMRIYRVDPDSIRKSCDVLAFVLAGEQSDIVDGLDDVDLCSITMDIFKEHVTDVEVIESCCRLLHLLLSGDRNRSKFKQLGIGSVISETFRKYVHVKSITSACFEIVQWYKTDGVVIGDLGRAGFCEIEIDILKECRDENFPFQTAVIDTLLTLVSYPNQIQNINIFCEGGGEKSMLEAIHWWILEGEHKNLIRKSCDILSAIWLCRKTSEPKLVRDVLFAVFTQYIEDEHIFVSACKCLRIMIDRDSDCLNTLVTEECIVNYVVEGMNKHYKSGGLKLYADFGSILYRFVDEWAGGTCLPILMPLEYSVDVITNSTEYFSHDPRHMCYLCAVLYCLTSSQDSTVSEKWKGCVFEFLADQIDKNRSQPVVLASLFRVLIVAVQQFPTQLPQTLMLAVIESLGENSVVFASPRYPEVSVRLIIALSSPGVSRNEFEYAGISPFLSKSLQESVELKRYDIVELVCLAVSSLCLNVTDARQLFTRTRIHSNIHQALQHIKSMDSSLVAILDSIGHLCGYDESLQIHNRSAFVKCETDKIISPYFEQPDLSPELACSLFHALAGLTSDRSVSTRIGGAGLCPVLAVVFQTWALHAVDILPYALQVFSDIVAVDNNCTKLGDAKTLLMVLSVLCSIGELNVKLGGQCAALLRRMVAYADKSDLDVFGKEKGCSQITHVIRYHACIDEAITLDLCHVVLGVSNKLNSNKKLFCEYGVTEVLIQILRTYNDSPSMVLAASGSMRSLSFLAVASESIFSAGYGDIVVSLLGTHMDSIEIVDNIVGTLANITSYGQAQRLIADALFCDVILESFRRYNTSPAVCASCCRLFNAQCQSVSTTEYLCSKDLCDQLVRALGMFHGTEGLLKHAAVTARRITSHADNIGTFLAAGCVAVLCDVLKTSTNSALVVENTIHALTNVLDSTVFRENYKSTALDVLTVACKYVASSLTDFPTTPTVIFASCRLLNAVTSPFPLQYMKCSPEITRNGDMQQILASHGVVDMLCKASNTFSDQVEILCVLLDAMTALSLNCPANQALFAAIDPYEIIIGSLKEAHDNKYPFVLPLARAVSALCEKCKGSADCVVLYGGCQIFFHHLTNASDDSSIVQWCCRALCAIYDENSISAVGYDQSITCTMCRCLTIHMDRDSSVTILCKLLGHLLHGAGMVESFGRSGICALLARSVVLHASSPVAVVFPIFAVIRQLSELTSNIVLLLEAGMCSFFLRMLTDRADSNAALVGEVSRAMTLFVAVESCGNEFLQCPEVYSVVCSTLKIYVMSDIIVCNISQFITSIVQSETQRVRIGETPIFEALHACFASRIHDLSLTNQGVLTALVQVVSCVALDNVVNAAKMRMSGVCDYVASIFSLSPRDCILTRHTFSALGILCVCSENKKMFATATYCSDIIDILEKGMAENDFAVIVLTAIYKMCSGYAAAKELYCEAGLYGVVLEILRTKATCLEVVSVSCAVLWSIVNGGAKNASVMSGIVGCAEVIVETLRLHLNIPVVSGALCGILSEILGDKNHFSGLRIRAVDEIALSLISFHKKQPEFALNLALRLLRLMQLYEVETYGSDTNLLKVKKIVEIMAELFISLKADVKILLELCGLLTVLVSSELDGKWSIVMKYPFVEHVSSTLLVAIKAKNTTLAATALRTLVSLCVGNGTNQDNFGKFGACASVLTILHTMECSSLALALDLEVACLSALVILVRHGKSKDSESANNIDILMKQGVCDVLLACLLKRLADHEECTALAARAVFYLAGNDQCSARLTRGGACEAVIEVHRCYASSVVVSQFASGAVANLALWEDANALLINAGAVEALIGTLTSSGYQDGEVAKITCIALDNLMGDRDSVRKRMGDNQAVTAVLHVLHTFESDETVVKAAGSAAANLVANSPENANVAFGIGGCNIVMECGGIHKNDSGMCYSALLFCISMCNTVSGSTQSFLEHGVCSLILHALITHCRIKQLVRLCCVAVNTLCQRDESAASMVGTFSVPEKLVEALQHHVQDPAVIIVGIRAVVTLMKGCPQNRQRFNSIHTMRLVFCALSLDPIPRPVAVNACDSICFLSRDVSSRMLLKQADVCSRVCALLKLFMVDEDMVIRVCACIRMLTKDCVEVKMALIECAISEPIIACFKVHCVSRDAGLQICGSVLTLVEDNLAALPEFNGEVLCQAVSSFMVKYHMEEDCALYSCRLLKLLARSEGNRKVLGGCGVCGIIAVALTKFIATRDTGVEILSAIHALAVDNKANVEILGFKGTCEGVSQALLLYVNDLTVLSRCLKIITCLCTNSTNSSRLGKNGVCGSIVSILQTHGSELGLLKLACLSIGVMCSNADINRTAFVQGKLFTSFTTLIRKYTSDAILMDLICVAIIHTLDGGDSDIFSAFIGAQVVPLLADILQANLGISHVINSACRLVLSVAMSFKASNVDFAESGICEKLVVCLSCHLSDKNANIDICACVRVIATNGTNKYTFGKLGACDVLWKALQFAVDFEDMKLTQAALITIAELVRDCCANQEYFSKTEICNVVSEVVGAENGVTVDENALWCISYLCRCSDDISTIHEQNCGKFGENGVFGSIVTVLQEHHGNTDVMMAGLTALRNLCGHSRNIGRIGVFGCCQLTCTILHGNLHDANICRIGCDAISCFAAGNNIQELLECDIGELLTLILRRHADKIYVFSSACECIKRIIPDSHGECVFQRGVCSVLTEGCRQHPESALMAEKICDATKILSDENMRYKLEFGNVGMCEMIVRILKVHAPNTPAVSSAVSALNCLMKDCQQNEERVRIIGGMSLLNSSSLSLGLWTSAMAQE